MVSMQIHVQSLIHPKGWNDMLHLFKLFGTICCIYHLYQHFTRLPAKVSIKITRDIRQNMYIKGLKVQKKNMEV